MYLKTPLMLLKRQGLEQARTIFVLAVTFLSFTSFSYAKTCGLLFGNTEDVGTVLEKYKITTQIDNPEASRNSSWIVSFKNSSIRAKLKELDHPINISNEVIAYLVSERTGMDIVPYTTKRKIDGQVLIMQEFKEGYTRLAANVASKNRPFKLRSEIFDYLVHNSDTNPGDIIYNPVTKKEAYIDSEMTFDPIVLDNMDGLPVSHYEKLPPKSRPKISTFNLKMQDYLSDKIFLDKFALLDAIEVFSNLPHTKDEYQRLGIIEARWRMENLQERIRKLQQEHKSKK